METEPSVAEVQKNWIEFDFDKYSKLSENETDKKVEMCLEYLSKFVNPSAIIGDQLAYMSILNLNFFLLRKSCLVIKALLSKLHLVRLAIDVLAFYRTELKNLLNDDSNQIGSNPDESHSTVANDRFNLVYQFLKLLCNSTNPSKEFCHVFHDARGTQVILSYMHDLGLIKNLIGFTRISPDNGVSNVGYRFLNMLLTLFYNVSSISGFKRKDFINYEATKIVRELVNEFKNTEGIRTLLYLTIANIVSDSDIKTLPCMQPALDDIIELVKKTAHMISNMDEPVRKTIDIDASIEVENLKSVCYLDDGWNIIELFDALYRLAVTDILKKHINESLKGDLKTIIQFGNETEAEFALKLVWQLCFDVTVASSYKDSELLKLIEELLENCKCTKTTKKSIKGILWLVNQKTCPSQANPNPSETGNQHIMISYNSLSRALCLKIKQELEKQGHAVWIDVEKIHGSSLEAMAKAVETSLCVLMCMTESYKLSPNCRAVSQSFF
jgi:hypothetical protein